MTTINQNEIIIRISSANPAELWLAFTVELSRLLNKVPVEDSDQRHRQIGNPSEILSALVCLDADGWEKANTFIHSRMPLAVEGGAV